MDSLQDLLPITSHQKTSIKSSKSCSPPIPDNTISLPLFNLFNFSMPPHLTPQPVSQSNMPSSTTTSTSPSTSNSTSPSPSTSTSHQVKSNSHSIPFSNPTRIITTGSGKRIGRVLTACTPCRQSKRKCTGESPSCLRCSRLNLSCVYEMGSTSGRKSNHTKHNHDTVQPYAKLYQKSQITPKKRHDLEPLSFEKITTFDNVNNFRDSTLNTPIPTNLPTLNIHPTTSPTPTSDIKNSPKRRRPLTRSAQTFLMNRFISRFYVWTPMFHIKLLLHRFNAGQLPKHLLYAIYSLAVIVSERDKVVNTDEGEILSDETCKVHVGISESSRFYRSSKKLLSDLESEFLNSISLNKPIDPIEKHDLVKTYIALFMRDCWILSHHGPMQQQLLMRAIHFLRHQDNTFREDEYILSTNRPTLSIIHMEERRRIFWLAFRYDRVYQYFIKDVVPFIINETQCFVSFPINDSEFQAIPISGNINSEILMKYEAGDRTIWKNLSALTHIIGQLLQFNRRTAQFLTHEQDQYGFDDSNEVQRFHTINQFLNEYKIFLRELHVLWQRVPAYMRRNPMEWEVLISNVECPKKLADLGPLSCLFYTEYYYGLSILHKARADLELAKATYAFSDLSLNDKSDDSLLRFDINSLPSSEKISLIFNSPDNDIEIENSTDTMSIPNKLFDVFSENYQNLPGSNIITRKESLLDTTAFLRQVGKAMAITNQMSNLLDRPLKFRKALDCVAISLATVLSLSRLLKRIGQSPGCGGESGAMLFNVFIKYYNQLTPAVEKLVNSPDSRGPWSSVNSMVFEIKTNTSGLLKFWNSLMMPDINISDQKFITLSSSEIDESESDETIKTTRINNDNFSFSALVSDAVGLNMTSMPMSVTSNVDDILSTLGVNDLNQAFVIAHTSGSMMNKIDLSPSSYMTNRSPSDSGSGSYSEVGTPVLQSYSQSDMIYTGYPHEKVDDIYGYDMRKFMMMDPQYLEFRYE